MFHYDHSNKLIYIAFQDATYVYTAESFYHTICDTNLSNSETIINYYAVNYLDRYILQRVVSSI